MEEKKFSETKTFDVTGLIATFFSISIGYNLIYTADNLFLSILGYIMGPSMLGLSCLVQYIMSRRIDKLKEEKRQNAN